MNVVALKAVFDEISPFLGRVMGVIGDQERGPTTYLLAQLASMCEYVEDAKVLIEAKKHVSLSSILRSYVELYLDLAIILKNEEHLQSVILEGMKNERDFLRTKLNGKYKLADDMPLVLRSRTIEHLADLDRQIKTAEKSGTKTLSVQAKFKEAGEQTFHDLVYPILCARSHNDLSEVRKRHLDPAWGPRPARLVYLQEISEDDLRQYLPPFCMFAFRAVEKLGARYELVEVTSEYEQIRASYMRASEGATF